jgi:hypothetical protein
MRGVSACSFSMGMTIYKGGGIISLGGTSKGSI